MERMSAAAVMRSIGLPQLLAGLDVEKRQDEENQREEKHCQILHRETSVSDHHPDWRAGGDGQSDAQNRFWMRRCCRDRREL